MIDKKKLNKNMILNMEILAFLRIIKKWWNDEIELVDVNDQNVKIPQKYLHQFLDETIRAFHGNLSTRIFGVDKYCNDSESVPFP